jgi:hypothetical protein
VRPDRCQRDRFLQLCDMVTRFAAFVVIATYMPFCRAEMRPTVAPDVAQHRMAELWREPRAIESADLFFGPWGRELAPKSDALYETVKLKTHGISPGLTVRDRDHTEWSVKQGDEGPVEVTLSRVLSTIGFHQPPIYFLPSFSLDHDSWIERAPGGRFRPKERDLKEKDSWSWQQNPFVGTKPYQGLLVTLMLFDSSDLKNSNNSLYELQTEREGATRWFVVRDIGTALGETGKIDPNRNDPDIFERHAFVTGVKNGFVKFSYHGWHQELVRDRITVADVQWACNLLARLNDDQWNDAFRAGGYKSDLAARFIRRLKAKIDEGRTLTSRASSQPSK